MPERTDRLELQLRTAGMLPAQEIAHRLGVSQPTVSRTLAGLGDRVVRFGAGRATRYALRRPVRDVGHSWPLYRINAQGRHTLWGTLDSVFPGFVFRAASGPDDWIASSSEAIAGRDAAFHGLPFFLTDLRPQGFLGRAIARSLAQSRGLPEDPRRWNDDVVLLYLHDYGYDLPGNLILGDRMLQQALGAPRGDVISADERPATYGTRAARATAGYPPGSSAGGEQSKFLACVEREDGNRQHVLVKFSPLRATPQGKRWADLFVAESIAGEVLRQAGFEAASGSIVETEERVYLEVARFDRIDEFGRRGLLSLEAAAAAFGDGADGNWLDVAGALERRRLMESAEAEKLRTLWWFGCLIGNSDMHPGNISVWFGDESLPFRLTPAYDMLPMLHAPASSGDMSERELKIPVPLPQHDEIARRMTPIAIRFWERVLRDPRISEDFRRIAKQDLRVVEQWADRFGMSR